MRKRGRMLVLGALGTLALSLGGCGGASEEQPASTRGVPGAPAAVTAGASLAGLAVAVARLDGEPIPLAEARERLQGSH